MENLVRTVTQILDTYFKDNVGNRENQWSFRTLKDVILNEIRIYKPGEKTNKVMPLRPIIKETVKKDKK